MAKDLEEMAQEMERLQRENDGYKRELDNFVKYAKALEYTQVPEMKNFEISAEIIPHNGEVGGDHITFVDFDKNHNLEKRMQEAMADGKRDIAEELEKNKQRTGMMVVDASGHMLTDAFAAKQIHNMFMNGVYDELTKNGQVTTQLFENMSLRFYNSTPLEKFATVLYGEINEDGTFKFLSAGHETPILFSGDRLYQVPNKAIERIPALGISMTSNHIDSSRYESALTKHRGIGINKLKMAPGDMMLLYTDGLSEHGENTYFPGELEKTLNSLKDKSVDEISKGLKEDILSYSEQEDDISYILVKRE